MRITKTKALLALIVFAAYSGYSQTYISWSEVETARFGQETIYKSKEDNKPLDGAYKLSENSGAYADVSFKNGKIHGDYISYDFSGKKESEASYVDGKVEGKSLTYFQNGELASESYYKNSLPVATWKVYNKKGEVISNESYKEGKKDGKWTKTLRNPAINTVSVVTEFYKDDAPDGHWEERLTDGKLLWEEIYSAPKDYVKKTYHPNGKLAEERLIVDGKKNGSTSIYTPEGILEYKIAYENDYVTSDERYFKNGTLKSKTSYKYGKIDGLFERYSEEGIKLEEGNHKDTFKDGIWKIYDSDKGRLLSETTYRNGKQNGISKTYNRAKNVASEGEYLNGKKNGIWKHYDLAGDLLKELEFDKGKQVSEKKYN